MQAVPRSLVSDMISKKLCPEPVPSLSICVDLWLGDKEVGVEDSEGEMKRERGKKFQGRAAPFV